MNEEEAKLRESEDVFFGIGLALLLHVCQFALVPLTGGSSLAGIGIWQLIYQLPALVICGLKGRKSMMKGIIIIVAATFLLNATCSGLFNAALTKH